MPENSHYTNRVTPQHRKPKFIAWLEANLQPYLDAENALRQMDCAFDIDNAVGAQMDINGVIIGRGRRVNFDPADGSSPVLDDAAYNLLQRAKIAINQWDGTIPGVIALWENILPQYQLVIQDNQDMTMDLYITGFLTVLEMELVTRGYIVPKPMGVRINFAFITDHPEMATRIRVGGAAFLSITNTELPPYRPEQAFATVINAGGMAFLGISETPLPQITEGA